MKLSTKIMAFVFSVIITLLLLDSYFSIRREVRLFDSNMKREALLLGHLMEDLVINVWQNSGQEQAMDLIKRANKAEQHIKIRWVWLEDLAGSPSAPHVPVGQIAPLADGREVFYKDVQGEGGGFFYAYIPVSVDKNKHGALELSQSLSDLDAYTRKSVTWSLILIGMMVLASGLVLSLLGSRLINRPLRLLLDKTKRIGKGDFSRDLELTEKNELSSLATAMNQMCAQLAAAQEAVHSETQAKVSALEQLRHKERLATLGRLSAGVAHELGTPLNVIAGRATLIAAEDLKREEVIECSKIIQEQVKRMTTIIQQLLNFARRKPVEKFSVNIKNLVTHVLEMLKPMARKQAVNLELEDAEIPWAIIDQAQIQQVLTNLVMNGIQSMPEGGRLQVKLYFEHTRPSLQDKEEDYLAIQVKDEGEGISEENINHVFEPFFTTKDVGKGSGLGLSITYGIVQDHGGWIDVKSEIGKGSCFTVYLPLEATA